MQTRIQGRLLVRADANSEIGTGHVMRCLALAGAWRDAGGEVVVVSSKDGAALAELVRESGFRAEVSQLPAGSDSDALHTAALARSAGADLVVIDGYQFCPAYQGIVKTEARVLWIDDGGQAGACCADIILNQNISADPKMYSTASAETMLLLGTRYALLRPEFLEYRNWKRDFPPRARRILITLGGSDPAHATVPIAEIVSQIPGIDVRVVIGPAVSERETMIQRLSQRENIEFLVAPDNMAKLMEWADVAISAAGSTCWELAFMGLPSILIVVAENQRPIAEGMKRAGAVFDHWPHSQLDDAGFLEGLTALGESEALRRQLSANASALVDGWGGQRVVESIARAGAC